MQGTDHQLVHLLDLRLGNDSSVAQREQLRCCGDVIMELLGRSKIGSIGHVNGTIVKGDVERHGGTDVGIASVGVE